MSKGDEPLAHIARAILDGESIDWLAAESSASGNDRGLIDELRLICSVADIHRQLSSTDEPDALLNGGPRYWGRLRLIERVGGGTFGEVYRAWDPRLQREVALKLIDVDDGPDDRLSSSILREARLLARVRHPGIVTLFDAEQIAARVGLWMEFVDGPTLQQRVEQGGAFSADEVIDIGGQLCDALSAVHQAGVLHRDVKASNVVVTRDGQPILMDFGAGRRFDERATAHLTGTPLYLAPEVFQGRAATIRSDIYSLGVLLHYLLTGSYPVAAGSLSELHLAHEERARAARAPRQHPAVPRELAAVLERATDPVPERRHPSAAALGKRLRSLKRDGRWMSARPAIIVVGLIVVVLSLVPMLNSWRSPRIDGSDLAASATAAAPVAIAILPLFNPDRNPELEYLTDGIAESVIGSLAQVPGKLKVMSLTAVMPYRDRRVDVAAVGMDLNVSAVLLGSIVQRGEVVVADVELVSAKDRSRLWGDKYTTHVRDLVEVERDIATRIVAALRLRLTGGEQQALRRQYPSNPAAYPLYLLGRDHWYRSTPDDYHRSLEYFQQAIQLDSSYALAHVGIARALSMMAYEGHLPPSAFRRVKEAASTALTIDPSLGPAHEALGYYNFAYEWNWTDAELEFKKAIVLSPEDEATHRYYGMFLRAQRRWDEAIDSIQRAVSIDPRSAETVKALGATYFWAGQYDRAIEHYRKACDLDPTHLQARDLLADAYAAKGMYAEALEARREYLRRDGAFDAAESLGSDASEQGYQQAMRALYKRYLQALERAARTQYVSPLEFALVYIGLGEKDRAFSMLEKAYGERSPWLASLAADPAFDPLRSDPRFPELLRRVGLSDLVP